MRLEINAQGELQIRQVCFEAGYSAKLLYISDLHLTRKSKHIYQQIIKAFEATRPDVILLGGDLADRWAGLPLLYDIVKYLSDFAPVLAIAGNHDIWVGVELVRQCIESGGGKWLDTFTMGNGKIQINSQLQMQGDSTIFSILCAHDPAIFPQAVAAGYKLVLAGHLHGSQCVIAKRQGRLYPGAWFFRWNGDFFQHNTSQMVVSRGVNDTLPIRWNCPREVILCSLQ